MITGNVTTVGGDQIPNKAEGDVARGPGVNVAGGTSGSGTNVTVEVLAGTQRWCTFS